jgi:hypothetical protein
MVVSKSGKFAISISVCATLVGCDNSFRSAENSAVLESSVDATLAGNFTWGAVTPSTCRLDGSYTPGSSCTMADSFAPQTASSRSRALTITDNAPNSPHVVSPTVIGVATAPAPTLTPSPTGAQLLFKSGFEGNVSLGSPYNVGPWGAWQDVVGDDTSTGFSFGSMVFGNKFTIQLLSGGGILSDVIQNSIVSMTGHTGATTRALQLDLKQKVNSASQDQFMINVTQSPKEFYISEWIMYPADLAQRLGPRQWVLGAPEWKSEGDFRIVYGAYPNLNGKQCWEVTWDTNANGTIPLQVLYTEVNCNFPVPQGQWFRVETYTRRGYGSDGRSWLKINGQLVFDHTGTTIGQNAAPINRLFISGAYANFPVQTHIDDFEIWDKVPY